MQRANPFESLDDFAPKKAPAKPVEAAQIDRLAEASGFPSRQRQSVAVAPAAASPVQAVPPVKPPPRRYTTGRNQQLNVKAKAETVARFYRLADERAVPLGELLDQALLALEKAGNPK